MVPITIIYIFFRISLKSLAKILSNHFDSNILIYWFSELVYYNPYVGGKLNKIKVNVESCISNVFSDGQSTGPAYWLFIN